MQIAITNAQVCATHDGQAYTILAGDQDGRQYYLAEVALPYRRAVDLLGRVKQAREININLWHCHVPYGTAAWLIDGMEERQIEDERFGYC
jgi:hypothetical protein